MFLLFRTFCRHCQNKNFYIYVSLHSGELVHVISVKIYIFTTGRYFFGMVSKPRVIEPSLSRRFVTFVQIQYFLGWHTVL